MLCEKVLTILLTMIDKFERQNKLYRQPYHHLAEMDDGAARIYRVLVDGLEYLNYVQALIELVVAAQPKSVAEVGCGDGRILCELARVLTKSKLTGYDISPQAILFAQAYAQEFTNLRFIAQDFSSSANQYDAIICAEVLEHIPDEELSNFIANLAKHLTAKGKIFLTVPSTNVPVNPKHYRHYSAKVLAQQMAPLLVIEQLEYVCQQGIICRWIQRLLSNRWFILTDHRARQLLTTYYKNFCRNGSPQTGRHLVAVCIRRGSPAASHFAR